ncbi:MAG: Sugar fermentation stimulation protein SfsA [Firmicutes bacterium]|nr:Sugar fermentation stimulation protein SfsA [Bacillota bacterium]
MITTIPISGEKKIAKFIKRLNRFEVLVEYSGKSTLCHVANTGRMKELLVPGRDVVIRRTSNPRRKTEWDLIISNSERGVPVFLESVMANRLIAKALREEKLKGFKGYSDIKREVNYGSSRFDIRLRDRERTCYIEVKCVTLVDGSTAKFPDAPTERGKKHVLELARAKADGCRSAVMIVAQREDAGSFTPNWDTDPGFSRALVEAEMSGVEVYAYNCRVSPDSITLLERIAVDLGVD